MTLKEKIKEDEGFKYVVQSLQTLSPIGLQRLMDLPFCNDATALEQEGENLGRTIKAIGASRNKERCNELRHQLMCIHDLRGTLNHLKTHVILDEIELFEIKSFVHLADTLRTDIAALGLDSIISIPDTKAIFVLLDPDSTGVSNFYIYDSYDPRLGSLRKRLKALRTGSREDDVESQSEAAAIFAQQKAVEQEVIVRLSEQLFSHTATLEAATENIGYCDLLFAKAAQAIAWGLTRPVFHQDKISYKKIFFPRLKHHKQECGQRYQSIDFDIGAGVCLITGANMAGKTVLLKTVGCAQLMAQFGMFVPAEHAEISLFDDIVNSIGDDQDEMHGLSSFASEILRISNILRRSRNERLLILIDEPARTTNPVEGKAMVKAMCVILQKSHSISLVTTHYSKTGIKCHAKRVKGFTEATPGTELNAQNINQFIDYTLEDDDSDNVPQEAIRIAEILGCDKELISLSRHEIEAE